MPIDPVTGICDCHPPGTRGPRCEDCRDLARIHHAGTARVRGARWGERRHGQPWPADAEVQVRALVGELAGGDAVLEQEFAGEALEHAREAWERGPVRAGGVSFRSPDRKQ